jgi:O-antigen/teichoic acid export membrane protein
MEAGAVTEGSRDMKAEATAAPAQPRSRGLATRMSANVWWTLTWLVIVILARARGPAAVGVYALALALTAPVMCFASLQMRTLLASDMQRKYSLSEYLRVTWITTVLGVLACAAIAVFAARETGGWAVLGAVLVMRAGEAFTEVYFGLWQRQERMKVIGVGRLIQASVTISFVGGAALLGGAVLSTAVGAALGSVALVAYLYASTIRARDIDAAAAPGAAVPSWRRLTALSAEGLPLGVIMLLGALQLNVPRYFVELHAGKTSLGLFAAATQLTAAGNIFVAALGAAAASSCSAASRSAWRAWRHRR